jgi:small subunit ribosomal protein S4
MIGKRKIDIPSYTVTVGEEGDIHFAPESKIPEMLEKTKPKTEEVETPVEATSKDKGSST